MKSKHNTDSKEFAPTEMVFILTRFILHWLPEFIENKRTKHYNYLLEKKYNKEIF